MYWCWSLSMDCGPLALEAGVTAMYQAKFHLDGKQKASNLRTGSGELYGESYSTLRKQSRLGEGRYLREELGKASEERWPFGGLARLSVLRSWEDTSLNTKAQNQHTRTHSEQTWTQRAVNGQRWERQKSSEGPARVQSYRDVIQNDDKPSERFRWTGVRSDLVLMIFMATVETRA